MATLLSGLLLVALKVTGGLALGWTLHLALYRIVAALTSARERP